MSPKLRVVEGGAGTLRGYYHMLERIQLELASGLRALQEASPELVDMSSAVEVTLQDMKTAVVSEAMITGELKW